MTKKKIFLLMMVIVTLIGMSAVSAAENATDDIITADTNEQMNLEEINDEAILNENDKEYDDLENVDDESILGAPKNRFDNLYEAINGNQNTEIHLDRDYFYDHHTYIEYIPEIDYLTGYIVYKAVEKEFWDQYREGIPIDRAMTIYGHGHTIDAKNLAHIFNINHRNVTFIDIKLINSVNSAIITGGGFTAINCTFNNNNGQNGGAIYGCTAINCTFNNNNAKENGGAIYDGTAINCIFNNNNAKNGGAMYMEYAENCTFNNNNAKENGGAIHSSTAINCTFNHNNAENGGAAHTSVVINSKFENNIGHEGGAISYVKATECEFTNNTAFSDGGAAEKCVLEKCNFTNNRVSNDGGAIYDSTARNCLFMNNTAEYGGAMYMGIAENCKFIENTAEYSYQMSIAYGGDGGAIFKGNATNCKFIKNKAAGLGGAIYKGQVKDSIFKENEANSGGALADTDAENCNFTQNKATLYGGAISYGNAFNCIFTGNTAEGGGALISSNAFNSIFIENKAGKGGAMYGGLATNCTFTNNEENGHPGSINASGKALLCIFNEGQFTNDIIVIPAYLIASNQTVGYNAGHKLLFNLTANDEKYDGFNTTLTIYENGLYKGTYYALSGADNGWTVNLEPGTYYAVLSIDNRPGVNNATVKLIVMTTTSLKADDMTTVYGTDDYLTVTLTYDDNKPVNGETIKVDLEGIKNYTVDSNGQIKVPTKGLDAGVHVARIGFDGDEDYLGSFQIVLITVNQAPTQISAQNVTTTYNNNKDLVITLKDNQNNPMRGFNLTVELNGTKTYTTDANGTVKVTTNALSAGTYDVNITFAGNENYTQANTTAKITINKEQSKITATDIETTYNINKDLVITLTDSKGNALNGFNITVDLNGAKTYTTNNNGQVTINTAQLVPNTYTAKITFNGNNNYLNSEKSVKVTVKKATSKITAKKKTFKKSKKVKKYTITLKSGKTPIKKAKVTIKIGKKTYKATTNAKGKATFKIKKLTKKGKYKAVIKYNGDNYYNKASKKVKITVK